MRGATNVDGWRKRSQSEVSLMRELNRRELLLKGTSAVAAAAAAAYGLRGPATTLLPGAARASTVAPPTTTWNHDPASLIGPSHWGEIDPGFATCAQGMRQSPVDFRTSRVREVHGPPLQLRYDASELVVENTGHVVEVPIPAGVEDVLQIGGDRYTLTQYHFHALSEHTVNGRHADVEGHFVHTNAAGDIAVVGVFYRIGPRPNRLLETILRNAPEISGEEAELHSEANPADLFKGVDGLRIGVITEMREEGIASRLGNVDRTLDAEGETSPFPENYRLTPDGDDRQLEGAGQA